MILYFWFVEKMSTVTNKDIITNINFMHGSIPNVTGFFNWPNPSSRTMTPGSTQPLTETSTRNISGGTGRTVRTADNLTAICEPTA
jgi:hypothetical protein